MKNREMKIRKIPLSALNGAEFQPSTRARSSNIKELKEDLEKNGQLYPLLVIKKPGNSGFIISDGHRRKLALSELGKTHAYCIVEEGLTPAEAFRSANTVRKFTTKEAQQVFLMDPNALTKVHRNRQQRAYDYMGHELFARLVEEGSMTASTVVSETKFAIKAIATIQPTLAASMENNKTAACLLIIKYGVTPASVIRKNVEYTIEQKGRAYRKVLKLSRRRAMPL